MEEEKDVNVDSSTTEEVKDVNMEQEASPVPQTEAQEAETSTQEVKPEVKDTRPIENVAWETKRKLDEEIPHIRRQIEELTSFVKENRTQPQTPTYTKAQLQAYASDPTTTTEQRLWAYTEVDKLEKEDRRREYETLVTSTQKRSETDNRRNQSAQWVAQNFPDTVIKDPVGNTVGWNNSSPVLARANEYMNRSENLRNDPEGFIAAVKMAAFDMGVSMNLQNKVNKTVGQLRKEQKKQLASSGGTRIAETSEVAKKNRMEKLKEEYARTGSKKAFAEIIKEKGLNPYV